MAINNKYSKYQYYYLIRTILFSNKYDFYIDQIKNKLDYEVYIIILVTLNDLIINNDKSKIISESVKTLIYRFMLDILSIFNETEHYESINRIISNIKINLNNAKIYDEEEYLLKELSVKLGRKISRINFKGYEDVIRTSIDCDFLYFPKILNKEIEINDMALFSYVLCINTYMNDIDDLKDNSIFNENVMKIMNYNKGLNRKQAKNNNIERYGYEITKKQTKKILKKMKGFNSD